MNLEDVIDPECGLQQDEWSLTAPTFGKDSQLTVIGWSGKRWTNKIYILKCNKCNQDQELFGEGYFKSLKNSLVRGSVPCGCSKKPEWSLGQYAVLCSRKAKEIGHTFLGFVGEWSGAFTKIKMSCDKHGEWSSGNIDTLISMGAGCPGCRADVRVKAATLANTKPDSVMITSFFASGAFHPDTKFWRSERKTKVGKVYWFVSCPECGQQGESFSGSLQKGQRPCACSPMRQQEGYINWLIDNGNMAVAIKFGIANSSKQRVKQQDRLSAYNIKQHSVYTFPSVEQCKKAERECRQELETGVVLKRDMSDGYTETTWPYNLERIIDIYQRNGGVLKWS